MKKEAKIDIQVLCREMVEADGERYDESEWETIDLRDENGRGMPVDEFVAIIKQVNEKEKRRILGKTRREKS